MAVNASSAVGVAVVDEEFVESVELTSTFSMSSSKLISSNLETFKCRWCIYL